MWTGFETGHFRCWVHKTANVLNKLPKSVQPKAKVDLKEIWMAEGRADAEKAFDRFLAKYEAKYDKATGCLAKDREALLAFYDFPAEHWKHIRTSNPIESTFATVRHRTTRSKGCLSHETGTIMVFKLILAAQSSWQRIEGAPAIQAPATLQAVAFLAPTLDMLRSTAWAFRVFLKTLVQNAQHFIAVTALLERRD